MAQYANLRKTATSPIEWTIAVNGIDITLSTNRIQNHRSLRRALLEEKGVAIEAIAPAAWAEQLQQLVEQVTILPSGTMKGR